MALLQKQNGLAVEQILARMNGLAEEQRGQFAKIVTEIIKAQNVPNRGTIIAVAPKMVSRILESVLGTNIVLLNGNTKAERAANLARMRQQWNEKSDSDEDLALKRAHVADTVSRLIKDGVRDATKKLDDWHIEQSAAQMQIADLRQQSYDRAMTLDEEMTKGVAYKIQIADLQKTIMDLQARIGEHESLIQTLTDELDSSEGEVDRLKNEATQRDKELAEHVAAVENANQPESSRSYSEVANNARAKLLERQNKARGMDIDPLPTNTVSGMPLNAVRPERVAISDLDKFSGDPRMQIDIHMWLRTLERYFQDKNQNLDMFGRLAGHYLTGQAQKVWECELNDLSDSGTSPTWEYFKQTMTSYYGTIIPAREQRAKYLSCAQKGSVLDFITDLKVVTQTLKNTAFAPSQMEIVEHFIRGLKADVRKYVEDQAPQGWWTDPKPLYEKAIQFEVNQHSHTAKMQTVVKINHAELKGLKKQKRFDKAPRAGRQPAPQNGDDTMVHDKRPLHAIPRIVQNARKGQDVCLNCGIKGHTYNACCSPYKEEQLLLDAQRGDPNYGNSVPKRKFARPGA